MQKYILNIFGGFNNVLKLFYGFINEMFKMVLNENQKFFEDIKLNNLINLCLKMENKEIIKKLLFFDFYGEI